VEATFTVRAVDFRGEARTDGGDAVEAELVVAAGGGAGADECKEGGGGGAAAAVAEARVAVAVADGGDGTYACAYTAAAEGRAALHVRVLGAPIAGSPFAVEVSPAVDSVLLTAAHAAQLREWCPGGAPRLELLFRATRDGWTGADFHRLCDNQGATVTVVRSTNGNVFGGFAHVPWAVGTNNARPDASAFLFRLVPSAEMYPISNASLAVFHQKLEHGGPIWGTAYDLCIMANANTNTNSYSNLGSTYTLPAGADARTVLAGSRNFQVAEYEVFRVR
jgi:hypothetical protein